MWRRLSSFPLKGIDEKLREHIRLVIEATNLLSDLIAGCKDKNWAVVSGVAEKIAMVEREADDVKREVEVGLYSGIIFVGLKEDFLRLAEAVDDIADKAKDAARVLATREPTKEEMGILFECSPDITKMIAGTVDIVERLRDAVAMVDRDANGALKIAHEVEKMEEGLDEQKLKLIKHLTVNEGRLSTLTYLQMRDFIFQLDMVADAAEAASDVLTSMIVKAGA
jgi:predicted phosphate transport protein (TIGR00153 family)